MSILNPGLFQDSLKSNSKEDYILRFWEDVSLGGCHSIHYSGVKVQHQLLGKDKHSLMGKMFSIIK